MAQDWIRFRVGTETVHLRVVDGHLEVKERELETEMVALYLTNQMAPSLPVLMLLDRLAKEVPALDLKALLTEAENQIRQAETKGRNGFDFSMVANPVALVVGVTKARYGRVPASMPAEGLMVLARSESEWKRNTAARHPNTPVEILSALLTDPQRSVRMTLAARSDLTEVMIATLAGDRAPLVRKKLASNPICPPELLVRFAADRSPTVRKGVGINPAAPRELQEKLSQDGTAGVRASITLLRRRRVEFDADLLARPEQLRKLAMDKARSVRRTAAADPDTPPDALDLLIADPEQEVRRNAARNPALSREQAIRLAGDVREVLASNRHVHPDALWAAWQHPLGNGLDPAGEPPYVLRDSIAIDLAANRACPPELLREVYRDGGHKVIAALVGNPATPEDLLRTLVPRCSRIEAYHACENPAMPLELLRQTLERWKEDAFLVARLEKRIAMREKRRSRRTPENQVLGL